VAGRCGVTREDFINTLFTSSGIRCIQQPKVELVDTIWLLRNDVIRKANELFDDLESRKCENCKWHEKDHSVGDCALFDQDMPCTGCNEFERKE